MTDNGESNTETNNLNLHYHQPSVTRKERQSRWQHGSICIWLTGLSGSGKSTLANALDRYLTFEYNKEEEQNEDEEGNNGQDSSTQNKQEIKCFVLDGDNIRLGINKDLSFTSQGRKENIRRVAEIAKLFVSSNTIVITAFISPSREDRAMAKEIITEGIEPITATIEKKNIRTRDGDDVEEDNSPLPTFLEVYLSTSIETCIQRDPKGLYKKALNGEIKHFTGIDPESPYEPPLPHHASTTSSSSLNDESEKQTTTKGELKAPSAYLEINTADGGSIQDHVLLIVNKLEELKIL